MFRWCKIIWTTRFSTSNEPPKKGIFKTYCVSSCQKLKFYILSDWCLTYLRSTNHVFFSHSPLSGGKFHGQKFLKLFSTTSKKNPLFFRPHFLKNVHNFKKGHFLNFRAKYRIFWSTFFDFFGNKNTPLNLILLKLLITQ